MAKSERNRRSAEQLGQSAAGLHRWFRSCIGGRRHSIGRRWLGPQSALRSCCISPACCWPLTPRPRRSASSLRICAARAPYINALDLNHGYRFFAPDPGPSHLIRYHLHWSDGHGRDGVFPNLTEERPRLLYHRYFMLAEHLEGLYEESQQFPEHSVERRNAEAGLDGVSAVVRRRIVAPQSEQCKCGSNWSSTRFLRRTNFSQASGSTIARLFQSVDLGTFTREAP